MPRSFAPVFPHGDIEQLFDDIWFVTGSIGFKRPPMRFSRNMTIFGHGGELTLINTLRLDDRRLEALEALGEVKHVIRIAGFHGLDDRFYADRYGAKVWCAKGMAYAKGFDASKTAPDTGYFQPDAWIEPGDALPLPGASLKVIDGEVPEGIIHLERDGGMLVTGDALQNWGKVDPYFSVFAGLVMRLMGFIKPHNVGPGWLKGAKPDRAGLRALLDLPFEHVLPAHGAAVIGGAREKFRPAIEKATR